MLPPFKPVNMESPDYAVAPKEGREKRFLSSINIDAPAQERLNIHQMSKWEEITRNEVRYEGISWMTLNTSWSVLAPVDVSRYCCA